MALLSDGKPWRSKHLIERGAEGLKPWTVRRKLETLCKAGQITKPGAGIWILPGMSSPSPATIPPFGTRGQTRRNVLLRLTAPVCVRTLAEELGVSRQRVDQILKSLMEQGKVVRIAEPGAFGRWLWVQSEADLKQFLRHYVRSLSKMQAGILNALAPHGFHSVRDIAAMIRSPSSTVAQRVRGLEAGGLVMSVRLGRKRYVGITPRGLDHPLRTEAATRAVISDLSKSMAEKRIAFLEALAVLSEARTMDITAALAGDGPPPKPLMSGQLMAWLVKSNFAEPRVGQRRPTYRLTDAGMLAAALIARHRTPPDRDQLQRSIALYLSHRADRLRTRSGLGRGQVPASPAKRAILDALGSGPLSTVALRPVVASYIRNHRSIGLMLTTLASRGLIENTGKDGNANVWSLSRQTQDEQAAGATGPWCATSTRHPRA